MQGDISRGAIRGGDEDFQLKIPCVPLPFDTQRRAVGIRGANVSQKKRVIEAARARVLDRNSAIDSVASAGEIDMNGLGDVEGSVRQQIGQWVGVTTTD